MRASVISPAVASAVVESAPLQRRTQTAQGRQAHSIDTSPRQVAQAQRAAEIIGAPVQPKLAGIIDHSPRLTAQAQRQAAIFGAPVQQQKAPAHHALPHAPEEDELHQRKAAPAAGAPAQATSTPNRTGLPHQLKAGVEALSGMSLEGVKVHYNSSKPAQLHAHAYAQGCDIHIGPGQEKHLPHEAWHVVQQAQGRVKPTMQMKGGVPVNDDAGLEREADVMGARAHAAGAVISAKRQRDVPSATKSDPPLQAVWIDGDQRIDVNSVNGDPISYLIDAGILNAGDLEGLAWEDLDGQLMSSLGYDQEYSSEFVRNSVWKWINDERAEQNTNVEDAQMDEYGQVGDSGSGMEYSLELDDLNVQYWLSEDERWMQEVFLSLNVISGYSMQVQEMVYREWLKSGVMTRGQMQRLADTFANQWNDQYGQPYANPNHQSDGDSAMIQEKAIQFKFGSGPSGPRDYTTSNFGKFKKVTYSRDSKGYIKFESPVSSQAWKNPMSGTEVDLEKGCNKKGWGLLKDNKTKVPLKSATRSQHFSIANRIKKIQGSGSPNGYTWHHLKTNYKMILVDRQVHRMHGHNGGVLLWT